MANIPINTSTSSSGSILSIDQALFAEAKRPMDDSYLNISNFENEFIRQTESNHLRPTTGIGFGLNNSMENDNFQGPALVLATSNNYTVNGLMQMDSKILAQQAAVIKQRFLGEFLLSHFNDLAKANKTKLFRASVTVHKTRLVADSGIGITLGVLYVMVAVAAASLAFLVNLNRRPLHLFTNPNKSSTAAHSLNDMDASAAFKDLDRVSATDLERVLYDQSFQMEYGKLRRINDGSIATNLGTQSPDSNNSRRGWFGSSKLSPKKTNLHWRPFSLQRKSGSLLILFLLSVTAALLGIYAFSRKRPL
jgi:hypothetical protein